MSQTAAPSLLESRGTTYQFEAYVTATTFNRAGTHVAWALGDGTLRLASLTPPAPKTPLPPSREREGPSPQGWEGEGSQPGKNHNPPIQTIQAHEGAILTLAPDATQHNFLTGGDDARFLRTTQEGAVTEIANFGSKWAEHVASFTDGKSAILACSAGKFVNLFDATGEKLKSCEHPSTVTGIAFDAKGKRLAASHYNGATIWFVASRSDTGRRLEWKGSHIGVALHPAAEAVVTAMQENALHGWRLPDGHDMRMSGYPAKTESLAFTRSGKFLASSGADSIVVWPFFAGGPMGKPPIELAQIENILCTRVAPHPQEEVVAAGYIDGSIIIADLPTKRVLRVSPPSQTPITALSWSPDGAWLSYGTESGFAALIDFSKRH